MSEELNTTAIVGTVGTDGIQLIFDGTSAQTEKEYKCNTAIKFTAGDRVKLEKQAGTYIVEYIVGSPNANYPIPSGGTDGQVLVKDGSSDYAVKWGDAGGGGGMPTGGSVGQIVVKKTATDYDVEWAYPDKIQASASRYISLGASALENHASASLGTSSSPFSGLYINGYVQLGTSAYSGTRLGFFGTTPISRQSCSSSASVSQLITYLKNYGLFS